MTLQSAGPWLGFFGGLTFVIIIWLARKQTQLGWPFMAVGAAAIVGPMASILRDQVSEPVQIAISLVAIGLSAAGMVGLFIWRWKRL